MKIQKTNAARLLDQQKIKYELIPYQVDESDLSAVHIAEQLSEPIECVFKTLVLKGDKSGYFVCVIPGDKEVDLKKADPGSAQDLSEARFLLLFWKRVGEEEGRGVIQLACEQKRISNHVTTPTSHLPPHAFVPNFLHQPRSKV